MKTSLKLTSSFLCALLITSFAFKKTSKEVRISDSLDSIDLRKIEAEALTNHLELNFDRVKKSEGRISSVDIVINNKGCASRFSQHDAFSQIRLKYSIKEPCQFEIQVDPIKS